MRKFKPTIGTTRLYRKFAWIPVQLTNKTIIWFLPYKVLQHLEGGKWITVKKYE